MSSRATIGLAAVLAIAFALLSRAPAHRAAATDARPAIDEDMPRPATDDAPALLAAPRTIDELRARIAQVLAREHAAGATFALVDRSGPIYVGGVGVRERATAAPMARDTAFRVGSLTKSVIALGVMRLVDQGKLDVDRPIREILPDVAIDNPWESTAPVTIAQCLEHTAGLDDVRFNEIFTDDEHLPVADALAKNPRSRHIRWQPGTRHAYSNVGYTLAARAIEVASGEPFDAYVRREVLAPMGITDADFARTGTLPARLATGYMEDAEPIAYHAFAHRPAGSLLASADDLAKLVHFWIVRGAGYPPIVSPAGLARIERSGTLPYPHVDSEYGFANYGDVMHPVLSRGHDGGMPGFHASYRYFPSLGIGYALLLNSAYTFRGYFELRSLLAGYLMKDLPPAHTPAPAAAIEPPGATYFSYDSPRNEMFGFIDQVILGWHVADAGDHVRVTERREGSYTLVPTPDGAYRYRGDCGSSVRFPTAADGTPLFVSSFQYGEAASGTLADLRYLALGLAMVLVNTSPLWSIGVLLYGAWRRRRVLPVALVVWPAVAGLCALAVPHLMVTAFFRAVVGEVHPLTVALFLATLGFAVAAGATLATTVRTARRADRPSRAALVMPMLYGLVFTALAVWLGAHGWIGLRTWAH